MTEFNLSEKMSKDKEDLELGAYVLTQKDVKEFIRRLKEEVNTKILVDEKTDHLPKIFIRIIDKLAGDDLK